MHLHAVDLGVFGAGDDFGDCGGLRVAELAGRLDGLHDAVLVPADYVADVGKGDVRAFQEHAFAIDPEFGEGLLEVPQSRRGGALRRPVLALLRRPHRHFPSPNCPVWRSYSTSIRICQVKNAMTATIVSGRN